MFLNVLWNEDNDLVESSKQHPIYQQSILKSGLDILLDTYIVYDNEFIMSLSLVKI